MATAFDWKTVPLTRNGPGCGRGTPAAKLPDPELGYENIPASRYISPTFLRREWDRMWTRAWLMGGRAELIPEAGDWLSHEVGPESFIFARQADGAIKGFYNVCPHRGNRLVPAAGEGFANSFKCGYHHWEWTLDGGLKNIPDRETFPQLDGACDLDLRAVRVGEWGGFIWFTMDPAAESLESYLGDIPAHLDPYGFERMKLIDSKTIAWDCNWKTSVDAFNEIYHVQGIHPELLSFLDDWNTQIDVLGRHNRFLVPFTSPSPRYMDQETPSELMTATGDALGIPREAYHGDPRRLRLLVQAAKRAIGPHPVYPYEALNDDQLSDDYHYMIFPNVTMNIYGETMLLFVPRPHPTDPDKMLFDLMNFAHLEAGTPHRYPERQVYAHGQISLGLVLDQDAVNLPVVQRGMHSRAYGGLILGKQELRIRHFHKTLMDYCVDDD